MPLRNVSPLILAGLCLYVMVKLWTPSSNPVLFGFSLHKIGALALVFAVMGVLLFALRSVKLARLVTGVVLAGILFLVTGEGALRLFAGSLPDSVMFMLPRDARLDLANQRPHIDTRYRQGRDLLVTWKPHAVLPEYPWIKIDANGLRNAAMPAPDLEAVILGSNIIFAYDVRVDLAETLNANGVATYSIAIGDYGPYRYIDAYNAFIRSKGIKNKLTVVFITLPQDLKRVLNYQKIKSSGGNYLDFLTPMSSVGHIFPGDEHLWVISVLNRLPVVAAQFIRDVRSEKLSPMAKVKLPQGTVKVRRSLYRPEPVPNGWRPLADALRGLASTVGDNGAEIIFVYYPGIPMLSLPHVVGGTAVKDALTGHHRRALRKLSEITCSLGARLWDATPMLQAHFGRTAITTKPFYYRLNQTGMDILAGALLPVVRAGLGGQVMPSPQTSAGPGDGLTAVPCG